MENGTMQPSGTEGHCTICLRPFDAPYRHRGGTTIHEADPDAPIKLYLRRVYLNQGGYDANGTYFGIGGPLFWYADSDGLVDAMLRASDRGAAIEIIRLWYPLATFFRQ